jgi:hypothetical protein
MKSVSIAMSLGIAMAVTPTSFDYSRTSTIVPRKHFQGTSTADSMKRFAAITAFNRLASFRP